jgi:hypothetical protein
MESKKNSKINENMKELEPLRNVATCSETTVKFDGVVFNKKKQSSNIYYPYKAQVAYKLRSKMATTLNVWVELIYYYLFHFLFVFICIIFLFNCTIFV